MTWLLVIVFRGKPGITFYTIGLLIHVLLCPYFKVKQERSQPKMF